MRKAASQKVLSPGQPSELLCRALEEEVLPDDIPALEQKYLELQEALVESRALLRALTQAEKPAEGVFFAGEIHRAKQDRMVLEYKHELCRVKINRLRLCSGMDVK